ncbi:MAG: DUF2281 domain-containing protein [Methylococcaceae bacterium]|nr:DUF2281 domain-containing protein [Methylococcaceae bacterium]
MPTIDLLALPPTAQQELLDFYQFLMEKNKATEKSTIKKTNFKTFLLNTPKIEGLDVERQQDYPKDVEF